ncbi:MAG: sigma-70 family RNA polymerase sigma factor [Bacteroidales bacterium]|nr:sigma-70 family RNA polymerase sigma factor [Bacteroidales bacterium]
MTYTDKELLELFRDEGSETKAFNLIVRKYQEKLYWHVRKIIIIHDDTDDIIQNTFLKAWRNLKNFKEKAQLYTWLYRIATNEAFSYIKQKKKNSIVPYEDYENYLSNTLESDVYFSGDEIQMKLQKAILTLPDKQRMVFNMKYFDEIKYEDMSEILGTSVGALKASYHHAVKKIEYFLSNN